MNKDLITYLVRDKHEELENIINEFSILKVKRCTAKGTVLLDVIKRMEFLRGKALSIIEILDDLKIIFSIDEFEPIEIEEIISSNIEQRENLQFKTSNNQPQETIEEYQDFLIMKDKWNNLKVKAKDKHGIDYYSLLIHAELVDITSEDIVIGLPEKYNQKLNRLKEENNNIILNHLLINEFKRSFNVFFVTI